MSERAVTAVHAVVVAFCPSPQLLRELLAALSPQVACVHVVDNTPAGGVGAEPVLRQLGCSNIDLVQFGENRGVGAALNFGIERARARGATFVLLSDQDSLPDADMVSALLQEYERLVLEGHRAGAVGPTFFDRSTGVTHAFQANVPGKYFYGHVLPEASTPAVQALTLITSGLLVPIPVYEDAGPMREDFFIDQIDIEWSHRARRKGWSLFGSARARMSHQFGDDNLRVWCFGWRSVAAYSALRIYYRVRNFVALCADAGISLRWKVRNGAFWLWFLLCHVAVGPERVRSALMAVRGVRDGLLGRMGAYPASRSDAGTIE